jgi:hypothetical protein
VFESALEDPGRDAVRRLVGLFKLSALGLVVDAVLFVVGRGRTSPMFSGLYAGFSVLCAAGAWAAANGIDEGKRWARNAGFVIAVLSLLSVGIGTIFGLIELYSLWRAQRGGQFGPRVAATDPENDA